MTRTLHIKFPLGQTLLLAVLILALVATTAELAARVVLPRKDLPTAVGSENQYFDQKVGILDQLAEDAGGIDCIFLGSSVVLNGLDPEIFARTYHAQTGESVTCYNFGVPALTAYTAGPLAEFLVDRYQPDWLIYGITLRVLADDANQADEVYQGITQTPWFQYKQGSFTVRGWLADHSAAFRYYLALRNWMRPTFTNELRNHMDLPSYGYEVFGARSPLDPETVEVPIYFANYAIAPNAWAGLERIVALQTQTQVLLVEMPLPLFFLEMFDGGADAYQAIVDGIGAYAAEHDVILWHTSPLDLIPLNAWGKDGHHVNNRGARILSQWLGEQVAAAVQAGELPDPGKMVK